ncbi:unnamed protein product [Diabrotica balteata]|uniref:Uncharacterized protein n=1 Tax=Diabrotica balteata TaxID=107213 RepID=A0A9N9XI27_DIABA|nr:unnamed protein product [Diabrotica balteata]
MSKKIKLYLRKEQDRETAVQWLEKSDDDYLSERDGLSDDLELDDNLEVAEYEPEILQNETESSVNFVHRSLAFELDEEKTYTVVTNGTMQRNKRSYKQLEMLSEQDLEDLLAEIPSDKKSIVSSGSDSDYEDLPVVHREVNFRRQKKNTAIDIKNITFDLRSFRPICDLLDLIELADDSAKEFYRGLAQFPRNSQDLDNIADTDPDKDNYFSDDDF